MSPVQELQIPMLKALQNRPISLPKALANCPGTHLSRNKSRESCYSSFQEAFLQAGLS